MLMIYVFLFSFVLCNVSMVFAVNIGFASHNGLRLVYIADSNSIDKNTSKASIYITDTLTHFSTTNVFYIEPCKT